MVTGEFELGAGVMVDVAKLIRTRCLVQANSGGGKSRTMRRLLEQSHGAYPQHVIDPEGEFHTLRERFDYVLAGRPAGVKGDCVAEPKMAAKLALKMLELGVSVVIDIFELPVPDRKLFVKNYLDALIEAPREMWRPLMVVVDEAQMFCPERGEGEAVSRMAIIDLMTRGRKRGLCGVLATQRLSALDKNAAAEANNVLIGRTALDVDLDRAGKALGYNAADRKALKKLPPGRFHAYGPAISDEVVVVQVGGVSTTHPEAGKAGAGPAPARGEIKRVLAELASLPEEAAKEAKTVDELRDRVRQLEREAKAAKSGAPVIDQAVIDRAVQAANIKARDHFHREIKATLGAIEATVSDRLTAGTRQLAADVMASIRTVGGLSLPPPAAASAPMRTLPAPTRTLRVSLAAGQKDAVTATVHTAGAPDVALTGPELRLLSALAWFEALGDPQPGMTALAFVAGYSPSSGTFNNIRGSCRSKGMVSYPGDGKTELTPAGRAAAIKPDIPMTNEGLQAAVMAKLDGPQRKFITALLPYGGEGLTAGELAEATGYSASSGTFNNIRGKLRSLGLVVYPTTGRTAAAPLLYPEG